MKKFKYYGLISFVIIFVSFFATTLTVKAEPVNCCDQWGEYRTNIDRMYCQAIGRVVSSRSQCGGSKTPTTTKTPTTKKTPTPSKTPTPTKTPTPLIETTWEPSDDSWKDAQGYKVTLIRYDYNTQTETPLGSILIYTSALVADIKLELPGPVPSNINQLSLDGVSLIGSQGITTSCSTQAAINDASSKSPESGKMGYNITTDEYKTSYRRVTYRGSDIIYNDTYVNSFLEEGAGPDTIDALVTKYAAGQENVLKNFGYYIRPEEADMIYVSAEPLQRLVDKNKDNLYIYGAYLEHEFTHTYKESDAWSASSWSSTYHPEVKTCGQTCVDGTVVECSGGGEHWSVCKAGVTTNKMYSSADCGTHNGTGATNVMNVTAGKCCSQTCTTTPAYYTYSLPAQKCGTKTRYLFFGYYGYGTSRIVTSRAMYLGLTYSGYEPSATDSDHLSRSENVKEEHEHCILDANDNCTNVYEYYIGPDLPKALVGTVSSNVYHFVDSSTVEGIEHYYWIDVEPCPDCGCIDVCDEVGPRDSDAYLMCAENYCEANVDYDLKGSQRERKKTCLIKKCKYVYGKEPDTGNQPWDYDPPKVTYHSESVNSCNNSDPFAIYKGRELLGNSSTCNRDDATGMEMQFVPGYFEECTSDQITDYDNNNRNDTAFDFRTYIVKTCLETTDMEYPDLSGDTYLPGEGIAYYVQQESNRECRYYMNLEQWKFDYASISAKDTARKKRLKYIYDTFNNALNESYNGKNSSYYYSGSDVDFVEEGYGVIDINSETYAEGKETINSRVAEVVLNQQTESATEKLNVIDSSKETAKDTYYSGDYLTLIEDYSTSYIYGVNRFVVVSKYDALYGFDKECLTTQGKSEIYKADSTGTCYKLQKGSVLEPYQGSNVHYTSLDATANEDFTTGGHHGFTTTALVVKDETGALYYQNTETCDYKVGKEGGNCFVTCSGDDTLKAELIPESNLLEGETRSYSLKVYVRNGMNKELVYSGSGNEYTFTPEEDVRYYVQGTVTSSILGETHCSNTCKKGGGSGTLDCTTEFDPVDLVGIDKYCKDNWLEDVHHFKGPEACVTYCSRGCPEDCLNLDELDKFCETNYENLGTVSKGQCINYCYCAVEGDYVFRPISNIEPFPDRASGPNWTGLEELITQDDDDISSITGVNANQTVEYVIDFTSNTIRSIRADTDKTKAGGESPYTDLIYKSNTNPTKCKIVGGQRVCETGAVSEYNSKFIHDSDVLNGGFSSIFVNGTLTSNGKSVAIEYTPGNDFTNNK